MWTELSRDQSKIPGTAYILPNVQHSPNCYRNSENVAKMAILEVAKIAVLVEFLEGTRDFLENVHSMSIAIGFQYQPKKAEQ